MKFLSSSPSSSSSSSSFDTSNVCNSKRATAGCIVGVVRRLLCSSSLPTYPSDHITESAGSVSCENDQNWKDKQKTEEAPLPNLSLVARLMGLETMPVTNSVNSEMTPNSITRSRSMNSVDYAEVCGKGEQGGHRRVKTSLSFREMPTYLELGNEEFFILSFENGGEAKELRSKGRKSEVGIGELKQRKAGESKNKENRAENVYGKKNKGDQVTTTKKVSIEKENLRRVFDNKASQLVGDEFEVTDSTNILHRTKNSNEKSSEVLNPLKPTDYKEVCQEANLRKKKSNHSAIKKLVPESGSEDSSPVSVLDFDEFFVDLKVPTSAAAEDSSVNESKSRRKLSPDLKNYEHPSSDNSDASILDDRKTKIREGLSLGSRKNDVHNPNICAGMWPEICRLADGEWMGSQWRCRDVKKIDEFENVGAEFGVYVLDQLLNELVDQLV